MEIFEKQDGKKKPKAQKYQRDGSEPLRPPVAGSVIRRTRAHSASQNQSVRADDATTTDQADAVT